MLGRVAALRAARALVLVGIGGHGAAGKSTLARAIPDSQVVGTDEFWDGKAFELTRLQREVVAPLRRGEQARFHGFDWDRQRLFPEQRTVTPSGVVVIEGVCALHRMFREAYDLRVWVEAPRDLRLARGVARDGEEARRTWEDVWLPMEDRYVASDDPIPSADLVVDGSGSP